MQTSGEKTVFEYQDFPQTTEFRLLATPSGVVVQLFSRFEGQADTYTSEPFSSGLFLKSLEGLIKAGECTIREPRQHLRITKQSSGSYFFTFEGETCGPGFTILVPFDAQRVIAELGSV